MTDPHDSTQARELLKEVGWVCRLARHPWVEESLAVKEVEMRVISAVLASVILLAVATSAQNADPGAPSLLKASFSRLPIYFVENRDVYPDDVAFTVQGADKTLFFTKNGITFRLKGKNRPWVVKLGFVGANPGVHPRGEDRQQAVFSYFTGPEKDWEAGLRTFARIVYKDLWPGIDLVYRGTVNRLKYEFVVAPGVDPGKIRFRYAGATAVQVLDSGALRVETPAGDFQDAPPVAWQEIDGKRVPVTLAYAGSRDQVYGFRLGEYDRTRTLILDPAILVYCGFIGGTRLDDAYGIAVDPAGNAYVTGETISIEPSFPVTAGPDRTYNGLYDAFVAKVNAAGTALVYCGYIGGAGYDHGRGIAVDAAGTAYVTGITESTEQTFPVKVGPDLTYNGPSAPGVGDVFVAKVNATGTALVYCGYIGGKEPEEGWGIAVDAAGNACVTGWTLSDEKTFPVKVGPDLTYNGGFLDAFVAKVNAAGTGLVYCGYIGGIYYDDARRIAADAAGNAYVTGRTNSTEATFPVAAGPDLTYNGGAYDAFVAKVSAAGNALVYCGYIGGVKEDYGLDIAVHANGDAFVTGYTSSTEQTFPVKVGPDLTYNGSYADAFVAKVNATGSALDYCGYIGGADYDSAFACAVDPLGNAYVAGNTSSDERTFPVVVGPDLTINGGNDAFVAKVNAKGSALIYCGYIGGWDSEAVTGIAVDTAGNAHAAGTTYSESFPVRVGPDLTFNGGLNDAFVAKIALTLLEGPSAVHTGGTVAFDLTASDDVGLLYQVASSFGTGPISIDARKIHLSADPLLYLSTWNVFPGLFVNYAGRVSPHGNSTAFINLPKASALIGVRMHSAFVTLDPAAPSGVKSISNTSSLTITK
jgi:hypothetical protein